MRQIVKRTLTRVEIENISDSLRYLRQLHPGGILRFLDK